MSSGEEFEVEEILEQRKRKGQQEYLVRWQGFGEDHDSWEPASSISHLSKVLKTFQTKIKQSRSKSRSRSRGRPRSKSSSRSRSRSASRRTPKKSPTRSSRKSASTGSVLKKEEEEKSLVKQETRRRSRSRTRGEQQATSTKTEIVRQSSTRKQESVVTETTVEKKSVETVQATPVSTQTSTMQTHSQLAVRQVQNDQKATVKPEDQKDLRFWWFADHFVLLLFIIVPIIAISFCVQSFSELQTKLTPDFSVLKERLVDTWEHLVQSLAQAYDFLMELLPTWGTAEENAARS